MPTDFFRYCCLVFWIALRPSVSWAGHIILVVTAFVGAALLLAPSFGMIIDASGMLATLGNPKFIFLFILLVVLFRLACAPYWIWKDDQKKIAALREDHGAERQRRNMNIAKLHNFYAWVGPIIERSLPNNISEDDFRKYEDEADAWATQCAKWIGEDMGLPACERFKDRTGMSRARIIGAVNEDHSNVILNLTRYRKNLLALIENYDTWDAKK